MEVLVGAVAEDLGPGTLVRLGAEFLEDFLLQESFGNLGVEELVDGLGVVADAAPGAGLVLDLDQDDGVAGIVFLEVLHELRESPGVLLHQGRAVRRRGIDRLSVLADHVEILPGVELHPFGHIMRTPVLPGGEPEEDQADIMRAGFVDDGLDGTEIELPFDRLDRFPIDGRFQRIGMHFRQGVEQLRMHGRPVV